MSAENDCLEGNTSLCLEEVRSLQRSTPIIELTQAGDDRSELRDRILARFDQRASATTAARHSIPAASALRRCRLRPSRASYGAAELGTNDDALYRPRTKFRVTHRGGHTAKARSSTRQHCEEGVTRRRGRSALCGASRKSPRKMTAPVGGPVKNFVKSRRDERKTEAAKGRGANTGRASSDSDSRERLMKADFRLAFYHMASRPRTHVRTASHGSPHPFEKQTNTRSRTQ